MSSRQYRIEVNGGLTRVLIQEIGARFEAVDFETDADGRLSITGSLDESALRALLELIWEVGGTALSIIPAPSMDGQWGATHERRNEK